MILITNICIYYKSCSIFIYFFRLAYGNESGIVVVDIVQKISLLNIGSPDLYGAQDPYSRAPRSPKRSDNSAGPEARSPSIDQVSTGKEPAHPHTTSPHHIRLIVIHRISLTNQSISSVHIFSPTHQSISSIHLITSSLNHTPSYHTPLHHTYISLTNPYYQSLYLITIHINITIHTSIRKNTHWSITHWQSPPFGARTTSSLPPSNRRRHPFYYSDLPVS